MSGGVDRELEGEVGGEPGAPGPAGQTPVAQSPPPMAPPRGLLDGLRAPGRADRAIGLLLAAAHLLFLLASVDRVGVPRDESFYFHAADMAGEWVFRLFDPQVKSASKAEIDRGFKYNHEHPVLMKLLFGVSHKLFVEKLGWIKDHRTGYRLPALIMASLAVYLSFLLGLMLFGRAAGVVAALSLMFMPRVFFHSQLACFDAPVTFMWLLVAYTFLRASRSRRWAIASGLALGLGLSTKLNMFFAPFTLLFVAILDCWLWKRRTGSWRAAGDRRGPLTYHTWTAVSMVFLGLAVFFAHWPWLWYDTWAHLKFYVSFHAKHVHYPVDYLGEMRWRPPFPVHFPFVFSLLTLPLATLLLAAVGTKVVVRRMRAAWRTPGEGERVVVAAFLLANALVPFLVIALPNTPIFGGTKHWMPAMPFLAMLAGAGAVRLAAGLWPRWTEHRQALGAVAVTAVMAVPAAADTWRFGPSGPSYYNELAGGLPGAMKLGMPRSFWGHESIRVLPVLNERVERGGLVFWHKATGWTVDAYKRDGLARPDLRYTGDWTAEYSEWAVYHDQREKLPEELDIWRAYGTEWPVDGYFLDGVQLVGVYQRLAPSEPPPVPPGGR